MKVTLHKNGNKYREYNTDLQRKVTNIFAITLKSLGMESLMMIRDNRAFE